MGSTRVKNLQRFCCERNIRLSVCFIEAIRMGWESWAPTSITSTGRWHLMRGQAINLHLHTVHLAVNLVLSERCAIFVVIVLFTMLKK